MKIRTIAGTLAGAGLALTLGQLSAIAVPGDSGGSGGNLVSGPDVIVGAIPDVSKFGSVVVGSKTIMAYSFGTTSCNIGTEQLAWVQATNQHPIIPQNLYRIKNGVLEQIGMSWMKHGFCALQQNLCGTCIPAGGGCVAALGLGCSDPYTSSLNGTQNNLGPRSQANASTGFFTYPFTAPAAAPTIGRRLQVDANDLDPALNAGATYFAECMYIHPQDAASGNANNNASHRKVNVGALAGGAYTLSLTGATQQQKPAIYAWQAAVPSVKISEVASVDGRLIVGFTATDNGNGTWHYEYAVMNLNSDASVGSVSIPVPAGVVVTNQGFHDVDSHSGEPFATTDWTMAASGGAVTWATQPFAVNSNANALRFGTTYNFRFDANTPPVYRTVSLGVFKSGLPVTFSGYAPSPLPLVGDLNSDGLVDGADLGLLLAAWGANAAGDLNGDGVTDGADIGILLGAWG